MKQSRTHNCGELRLADAGKQVTIVGWLEKMGFVENGHLTARAGDGSSLLF